MKTPFKAYKAFKKDQTCRGFKYEEGETYEIEGYPIICEHGFHFCKDLVLTLVYYPVNKDINENLYAEVEILGDFELEKPTGHKGVTNKIKILRFIPANEVSELVDDKNNSGSSNSGNWNSGSSNSGSRNSGNWNSGSSNSGSRNSGDRNSGSRNSGSRNSGSMNSGYRNSGDRNSGSMNSGDSNSGDSNSGYRNSGDRNSGNSNSGYRNSGDWNSCDYETGFFNSEQSNQIRVFNQLCDREVWKRANKPDFLYFDLLEGKTYKESFQASFKNATESDIRLLKSLPNFDKDVFFEISGIMVD